MKRLFPVFLAAVLGLNALAFPVVKVFAATPTNLITNSSVETAVSGQPTAYSTDKWGTNTTTFTYKATEGHTGTHSLDVKTTAYTDGDAKWLFDPVTVNTNTSYTFSDWYKSTAYADILIRYTDATGNFTYKWVGGLNSSNDAWKQFTTTFTTPASAKQLTVLHLLADIGHVQTDDFSLIDNSVAVVPNPGDNIVPNSSLETAASGKPQGWTTNNPKGNTVAFTYPQNGHTGTRSIKTNITKYVAGDAYWSFPEQTVTGGVLYEFSNWYKSNADTDMYAQVTMQDGTQRWIYIGTAWHSPDWNHFDQQFLMPAGAVSATVYQSLYQVGWVQSDDYKLVQYTPQGFNRGMVSITFDDGIESTYTNGYSLMEKYGLDGTFYIISSVIGNDPYYMTLDQLKALKASGHEIGSHSVTHPELINLTNTQINTELQKSRNNLQNWLSLNVTDFATPHGEYNSNVLTYAKKYYTSHRSVDVGFNSRENFDIYNIKVQNVVASTTTAQIMDWVNQAVAQHTWLVLVYHAVDSNTSIPDANWNTLPTDLDAQLAGIKASGAAVLPVNAALTEIKSQL